MGFAVKDKNLEITRALPNGAGTVASNGFDLGHGSKGDFLANVEMMIAAPALSAAELPDGQTIKYDLYHDMSAAFGSETLLARDVLVQTGAGGAGAAAQTVNFRFPVDVKRYVRLKATNSGTGNASGKSVTISLVA